MSGAQISFKSRYEKAIIEETPGPGKYDIKSKAVEGVKPSIKKRFKTEITKDDDVPGPGEYNPEKILKTTK